MLRFEYGCASRRKGFESPVRHSSPAPECPGCNGTELRKKLPTSAAITDAAAAREALPASCQGCDNAGGPGAFGFSGNKQ